MPQAPTIRFDPGSAVPAVRQIADSIRVLLVEGHLPAGAALPSIRRMAIELGVHFNTVADAYRELASEGWLDLKHGRGAHVIERQVRTANGTQVANFSERLRQLAAQMQASGIPPGKVAAEFRAIAKALQK